MTNTSENPRITWIDLAKGLGIILMVYGHLEPFCRKWIYSFHMPLFFILSGYVFSDRLPFKAFLKKKFRTLIIPYFALGIPMLLFEIFHRYLNHAITLSGCVTLAKEFLLQKRLWAIWFLTCLFLLNIIFYGAKRILKKDLSLAVMAVIFGVIGIVYYLRGGKELLWSADICFTAMPFFCSGYLCRQNQEKIEKFLKRRGLSVLLFGIFLSINIVSHYFNLKISGSSLRMYYNQYGYAPLTYLSAFAGSFALILLSKAFTCRPIQYIGANSLVYLAWNQVIMRPISSKLLTLMGITANEGSGPVVPEVYKLIQALLILGLLTLCNFIITGCKLRFMVGKSSFGEENRQHAIQKQ